MPGSDDQNERVTALEKKLGEIAAGTTVLSWIIAKALMDKGVLSREDLIEIIDSSIASNTSGQHNDYTAPLRHLRFLLAGRRTGSHT